MKRITLAAVIVLAAFLAMPLASEAARGGGSHGGRSHGGAHHGGFRHHGHFHSRVVIGFGPSVYWGYPYWYYPPPVYYPPVVVQETPPVYVQQPPVSAPTLAPAPEQYWYYCESAKGYYPQVPDCPEPWIKVAPRP